ncbi:hypothetical protein GCM10017691_04410 [Pseudonocardia petroleophila]
MAAKSGPFERGRVGAGTGATVGKLFGIGGASPGGLGTATVSLPGGVKVSAVVVVNAFGDVVCPSSNRILAGTRDNLGNFVNTYECQKRGSVGLSAFDFKNTTIGVVCTNAVLTKENANRVATVAQNGIARVIRPSHTDVDGDAIFAAGPIDGELHCSISLLGTAASEAVELAILDAVGDGDHSEALGRGDQ